MSNPIITLAGNLASDPELRFTANGKPVCNFRVLTNDNEKLPDGSYESKNTTGWDCVVWDKAAENVAESLKSGSSVVVVGKVMDEHWEDRETGAKRSKKKVSVIKVSLDLSRGPAQQTRNPQQGQQGGYSQPQGQPQGQQAPPQQATQARQAQPVGAGAPAGDPWDDPF